MPRRSGPACISGTLDGTIAALQFSGCVVADEGEFDRVNVVPRDVVVEAHRGVDVTGSFVGLRQMVPDPVEKEGPHGRSRNLRAPIRGRRGLDFILRLTADRGRGDKQKQGEECKENLTSGHDGHRRSVASMENRDTGSDR